MKDTQKKMIAALAAVNVYLEEEAALQQGTRAAAPPPSPLQETNIWALSGRQDMMSMRQLIQMKAFSRF